MPLLHAEDGAEKFTLLYPLNICDRLCSMRGDDLTQSELYSFVSPEERVPADHPLRAIRQMCDLALRNLNQKFEALYSERGRPSIAPEKLMRALLLQALYSVRSERLLMEELNYNLLFRWFVGLNADDPVWDATVFSKNRDRLLAGDVAQAFFAGVSRQARDQDLMSDEHFTVDGTLLEAWASKKSFQKKEQPPTQGSGSRGELRLRDTHQSKTDPDARMYRKSSGGAYQLSYLAHVLMENRSGLPVAARVTRASNDAEWSAAVDMLKQQAAPGTTVGADAGYDYARFTERVRQHGITPHVAQHQHRASSIDLRTTRHPGYALSLSKRKCIEQIFGWIKNTAGLRKLRHRGTQLVEWMFTLALSAYSLLRLRSLTVGT
jgi:transposase